MYTESNRKSSRRNYLRLVRENAGRSLDPEVYDKKTKDRRKLREQSFEIAMKMKEAGKDVFNADADMHMVNPITGEAKKIDGYKNVCFIPAVAAKNRKPMKERLFHYLNLPRNQGKVRMWVFNMGARSEIAQVSERVSKLNRNLGILSHEIRKKWGIDFLFRSTELGEPKYGDQGRVNFHVHAHVLVRTEFIKDWTGMLQWVHRRWRRICRMSPNQSWSVFYEGKTLNIVEEACKYVIKPDKLQKLTGPELVGLSDALFKKHLVQPMGRFKGFCAYMKRNHLRPMRTMGKDGVLSSMLVKNWNSKTEREKELDRCWRETAKELGTAFVADRPQDNVVVSVCQPSFAFGNSCMPALLVRNYTERFMKVHMAQFSVVRVIKKAYEEGLGRAVGGARSFSGPYSLDYRSITSEKDKPPTHDLELCVADPPH